VLKEPVRKAGNPIPTNLAENLDLLEKNYTCTIRGPVPAGGVQCRIIEFIPNRKDRPQREIWLEETCNIPVRVYISSRGERLAYRSEMEAISLDPQFTPDTFRLKVPQNTKVYEINKRENLSPAEAARLMNRPLLLPRSVPAGYIPYNIVLRMYGVSKRVQVIYSDGLSTFSVFQEWSSTSTPKTEMSTPDTHSTVKAAKGRETGRESRPQAPPGPGPLPQSLHRIGLINVVTSESGGRKAVFIGDINEDLLRKIAQSYNPE